jgi:hypothetical protein
LYGEKIPSAHFVCYRALCIQKSRGAPRRRIEQKMFRRSLLKMTQKQSGERTIVRDPRIKKPKAPAVSAASVHRPEESPSKLSVPQQQHPPRPLMPFEPSAQNQQSVGSTLGSYALAGFGFTLGLVLVRVVFGF